MSNIVYILNKLLQLMLKITLESAVIFYFNLEMYGYIVVYQTLQQIPTSHIFVLSKSLKRSNSYCIFKNVDATVKAARPAWYYFHSGNKGAITCISLSFFFISYHFSFLKVYWERVDKDKKVCVLLFAECKHFDLIKKSRFLFFSFHNRGKVKN